MPRLDFEDLSATYLPISQNEVGHHCQLGRLHICKKPVKEKLGQLSMLAGLEDSTYPTGMCSGLLIQVDDLADLS
jgi:hypothetical protein